MLEETWCIWILRWQLRKEKKKKRKEKKGSRTWEKVERLEGMEWKSGKQGYIYTFIWMFNGRMKFWITRQRETGTLTYITTHLSVNQKKK